MFYAAYRHTARTDVRVIEILHIIFLLGLLVHLDLYPGMCTSGALAAVITGVGRVPQIYLCPYASASIIYFAGPGEEVGLPEIAQDGDAGIGIFNLRIVFENKESICRRQGS